MQYLTAAEVGERLRDGGRYLRWLADQLLRQFLDYSCLERAGSLTYTTLFAVVPLMTVTYSMLSVLPEFASVGERIQAFVFDNFMPETGSVVQEQLSAFSDQARNLTIVGVGILVLTAFLMLVTVEKAFNVIWQVAEPRQGLRRFLVYWGVLSFGPPMLAGGLMASGYILSLDFVAELDQFGFRQMLFTHLPMLAVATTFTLLFYAVPNTHVPFRHAMFGGLMTTLAFEVAKVLFREVVTRVDTALIYGAFAAVPFFLMWLYLMWLIILAGAIFVRTLSLQRSTRVDDPEPMVVKCLQVLNVLNAAHARGEPVDSEALVERVALSREQYERVFDVLFEEGLLVQTEDERWTLGKDLRTVTLWDLYVKLPEALNVERLDRVDHNLPAVERLKAFTRFGIDELSISCDELLTHDTHSKTDKT